MICGVFQLKIEVIIDHGETANKCTIAPLVDRIDFRLIPVGRDLSLGRLNSPVLLHHEGECITQVAQRMPVSGIAVIDCIWRRLDPLMKRIERPLPLLCRIPDGFVTAYPRRSKDCSDPDVGLATIEAIFIALTLVGKWDLSLLEHYPFAEKFIALNRLRFQQLGVDAERFNLPSTIYKRPVRNSLLRRMARGRMPAHVVSV